MSRIVRLPGADRRAVAVLLAFTWASPVLAGDADQPPEGYDCIIEPSRVLELGSAAVGVLQEVRVDRSDRVEAGDVVALLESGVEAATVELARLRASTDTEVLARRVSFELQRSTEERTERLHATRVVAAQAREEAAHDARLSALRLRQAEEEKRLAGLELERARQSLARRSISSPIAGVVMERHKSPGERVEDQPILRIAQLHPLRVEVVLPVERYGTVRKGMRARVLPQYAPGGEFVAEVTAIDAVLDAASSTFGVRLSLPNPDYAVPGGLRCTLEFLPGAPRQADAAGVAPDLGTDSRAEVTTAVPMPMPMPEPAREISTPEATAAPEASSPRSEASARPAAPAREALPTKELPAAMPAALAARAPAVPSTVCRTLGPLDDEAQAERLHQAFAQEGVAARVRHRRGEVPVGYLVAVESGVASGDTEQVVDALRREGLRDFQVLTGRPGTVSVGYFRALESAEYRAARVQAIGLPARVEARMKKQDRYFLDLDLPAGPGHEELVARVLGTPGTEDPASAACPGMVTASR